MTNEDRISSSPRWRELVANLLQRDRSVVDAWVRNWAEKGPSADYPHWRAWTHSSSEPDLGLQEAWALEKLRRQLASTSIPHFCDPAALPLHAVLGQPTMAATQHLIDLEAGYDRAPGDSSEPRSCRARENEAIATCLIAGFEFEPAAASAMLRQGRAPLGVGEQAVERAYDALAWVYTLAETPITPAGVQELNARLTRPGKRVEDEGCLRASRQATTVTEGEGGLVYEPPPAAALKKRLARLCEFAESSNSTNPDPRLPFLHPLLRATLLHYGLFGDRPFESGNGRTARALFVWSMLRQGYPLFSGLALSPIIFARKIEYLRAFLHSQHDDGDLTYFILFQYAALKTAVDRRRGERRRDEVDQEFLRRLSGFEKLNARQLLLLAHAMKRPAGQYTVPGHGRTHNIVLQTARTDLQSLESAGYLSRDSKRRAHCWTPSAEFVRLVGQAVGERV